MIEPLDAPDKETPFAKMGTLALLAVVFMTVSIVVQKPFSSPDPSKTIGTIVAAGLTLVMYSFLYGDNPLFKIAENLYVGVALGYGAIIAWRMSLRREVYEPFFNAPTAGAFWNAALHRSVPVILGVLLLTRLSKKHGWLSRYAYALIVGWGAGVAIPLVTHSYILQQVDSSVRPFQQAAGTTIAAAWSWDWLTGAVLPAVGAAVVMIGTVAVLFYFFFSIKHTRARGVVSKVGIWFLMVSFGASFGYTVMGRVSVLIGRVQFLLFDWLNLPK